jgi:hypothetical protein
LGIAINEHKSSVEIVAERTSTTQEYGPAGFPEGTAHGLSHIQSVFENAKRLLERSRNLKNDNNPAEAYLLALAILLHDIALVWGDKIIPMLHKFVL